MLENWPLIADGDTYGETMKYLIFAAGDQPYEEITNNDMTEGPSCIVVKESFGNCFIPFLVNHYKNVYVVDYRHYEAGTVTQLAQEKGVDDVLLLSNISMTRKRGPGKPVQQHLLSPSYRDKTAPAVFKPLGVSHCFFKGRGTRWGRRERWKGTPGSWFPLKSSLALPGGWTNPPLPQRSQKPGCGPPPSCPACP